jgi:hypothetical protein
MKTTSVRAWLAVTLLGLAGCGSVTSNGGNDVPSGPAIPVAASAPGCTHDGTGVNAAVMPSADGSVSLQGYLNLPQNGLNPSVPPCYDFQAQQYTAPGLSLTQMTFTIKDGVVQRPSSGSVEIVTQWFEWTEPTAGTCAAEVQAVVNVTDGSAPTCTAELQFGSAVDAPIGTYAFAGP